MINKYKKLSRSEWNQRMIQLGWIPLLNGYWVHARELINDAPRYIDEMRAAGYFITGTFPGESK